MACRRHDCRNWLEIWDTGIGIAADKTEVIFEEFSQLNSHSSIAGSGLGLAITAKTADLLGLQIRVRSRPGFGSMFAVELPQGHAVPIAKPDATKLPPHPLHIALVENNVLVLDAIVCALESAGHVVTSATDGERLLQALGSAKPDIIIADYRLSALQTGFEVVEAVRRVFGASLPALMITGDTDPALIRAMSRRGIAIQYKPLQMEALLACVDQQIEQRP